MLRLPFTGDFKLTQEFGVNPQLYSQFFVLYPDGMRRPMKGHNGLDFGLPNGTDVLAPHDGTVIEASSDLNGYGNYIKIENATMGSVLAHLDSVVVQVGFQVKAGQKIGTSGNTGYSTAPHLHWGWYLFPRDRANGLAGFIDQTKELEKNGVIVRLHSFPELKKSASFMDNLLGKDTVSEKTYTAQQYEAAMKDRSQFWRERDIARADLEKEQEENSRLRAELKKLYDTQEKTPSHPVIPDADIAFIQEVKSLGYNKATDITKAINEASDSNTKLLAEALTDKNRISTLAREVEKMANEDSEAVRLGLNASSELKKLQDTVTTVARATDSKPNLSDILSKIDVFKHLAERELKKEAQVYTEKTTKEDKHTIPVVATKTQGSLLARLFGFKREGVN